MRSHYWKSEGYRCLGKSRCVCCYLVSLSLGLSLAPGTPPPDSGLADAGLDAPPRIHMTRFSWGDQLGAAALPPAGASAGRGGDHGRTGQGRAGQADMIILDGVPFDRVSGIG